MGPTIATTPFGYNLTHGNDPSPTTPTHPASLVTIYPMVITNPKDPTQPLVITHPKVTTCPMVTICPSGMSQWCCVSNFTIKTTHIHHLQVGPVEDRWSKDELAKQSGMVHRCCVSNFILICHQELHQDYPYHPSPGWICWGQVESR